MAKPLKTSIKVRLAAATFILIVSNSLLIGIVIRDHHWNPVWSLLCGVVAVPLSMLIPVRPEDFE